MKNLLCLIMVLILIFVASNVDANKHLNDNEILTVFANAISDAKVLPIPTNQGSTSLRRATPQTSPLSPNAPELSRYFPPLWNGVVIKYGYKIVTLIIGFETIEIYQKARDKIVQWALKWIRWAAPKRRTHEDSTSMKSNPMEQLTKEERGKLVHYLDSCSWGSPEKVSNKIKVILICPNFGYQN